MPMKAVRRRCGACTSTELQVFDCEDCSILIKCANCGVGRQFMEAFD